ncbi:GGDEF domain-containing protein [Planctobacterium marinum]|uniref:GGDEF domain-containing protein n=1 Tax=Planctobacterium marinum TaxID=1631968 RepID=UPI001E54BBF1|nr:GGDEF domain-containing protein [Planctobacterium marinum]MCC2607312.1 GGDEF domain-containing protein [Planctobacterium marinum]
MTPIKLPETIRLSSLVTLVVSLCVWLMLLFHFNADSPILVINYYDVVSEIFSISFVLLLLGVNLRLESETRESKMLFVGFCFMLVGDAHDLMDEFVNIRPDWIALLLENVATNVGIVLVAVAIFHWSGRYKEQLQLLNRQKEILIDASNTDPLTKLYNRRFLNNEFIQNMLGSQAQNPRTLLLLDLDRFKSVNDNYGHGTGDKLIVLIANVIKREIRQQDYAFRYGGEEFLVVLNCHHEVAHKVAERIRAQFQEAEFDVADGTLHKTVSIGLYEIPQNSSFEAALDIADKALYQAKNRGRNCVVSGTQNSFA